jgi:Fic family protein
MLLNHKAAIQFIVKEAKEIEITRLTICHIHALLSDNLLGDPEASGRIRMIPVAIGESTYVPLAGAIELTKYMDLFVKKARRIRDPFEQSFFSLAHLSYLQAFEDVNKRTSRLVANMPLVKRNLKPLSFADVPAENYLKSLLGIYEASDPSLLLDLYVWAYERSAQKYSAIQQSMGEMNVLKLKHREEIRRIIQTVVAGKRSGKKTDQEVLSARIGKLGLPKDEADKLFAAVETELASLHEGNIVLYQIKPENFRTWRKSRK